LSFGIWIYCFAIALIHFVQAFTLFPEGNFTHCKLGYCFLFVVGLNLVALNLTLRQTIFDFFPQSAQIRAIKN